MTGRSDTGVFINLYAVAPPEPALDPWRPRDGLPLDLIGKTVSVILIAYIIINRVIADRFVLPVGFSIRIHEIVLVMLTLAWMLWMMREPLPFPIGLTGLFGIITFAILGFAPFLHALTVTDFQASGAERGLLRLFSYTAMFLAAFHLSFRRREGFRILGWMVAATAFQAGFAVFEFLTATPVLLLDDLATSIGLIPDPKSIRGDYVEVFQRLSGEVRAVATAPHPIVLSAVLALAALVVVTWLIYAQRRRSTVWLGLAALLIVLALPSANSRTAFVILGVAAIPFLILHIKKLPKIIVWSLPAIGAFAVAFALSPSTPRLLLNSVTNAGDDQNTTVRLERFSRVPELLEERPYVGAGYLTHDPAIQIFDNAYNRGIIEFGVVGLIFFLAFLVSVLFTTWAAAMRAPPNEVVLPSVGVVAALALLAGCATFDALTFDQFLPTCLILMGLALGRSMIILKRPAATAEAP